VVTMGALGQMIVKYQKKSLAAYAEGGTVAEEVLSSIRNAVAFGTQDKLATEYAKHLTEAEKSGFKMKGERLPLQPISDVSMEESESVCSRVGCLTGILSPM
jgi:hypothetical protein